VYLVGFAVAAVTGILAIRMVELLVKSNRFRYFAIYTLLLGIAVVGYGIFELVH
jgi:undecaprenyl-diphosphatase